MHIPWEPPEYKLELNVTLIKDGKRMEDEVIKNLSDTHISHPRTKLQMNLILNSTRLHSIPIPRKCTAQFIIYVSNVSYLVSYKDKSVIS